MRYVIKIDSDYYKSKYFSSNEINSLSKIICSSKQRDAASFDNYKKCKIALSYICGCKRFDGKKIDKIKIVKIKEKSIDSSYDPTYIGDIIIKHLNDNSSKFISDVKNDIEEYFEDIDDGDICGYYRKLIVFEAWNILKQEDLFNERDEQDIELNNLCNKSMANIAKYVLAYQAAVEGEKEMENK